MEYDEIDQYVDQLFRDNDPGSGKEIRYSLVIAKDGRIRSDDDLWQDDYSQSQMYNQSSLRGLTCAEWILIAAIGMALIMFLMIKG